MLIDVYDERKMNLEGFHALGADLDLGRQLTYGMMFSLNERLCRDYSQVLVGPKVADDGTIHVRGNGTIPLDIYLKLSEDADALPLRSALERLELQMSNDQLKQALKQLPPAPRTVRLRIKDYAVSVLIRTAP